MAPCNTFFFAEKQLIFLLFTNKVALDRYKYRKKILQPYDTKHIPQKWFVHQLWSVHYFLLNTILTGMQSTFEEMLHKLIKKITNNWIQQVHKQSIFTFHKTCKWNRQKPNMTTTFNLQCYITKAHPSEFHCSSIKIQSTTFIFYVTLHWDAKQNLNQSSKTPKRTNTHIRKIPCIQKIKN